MRSVEEIIKGFPNIKFMRGTNHPNCYDFPRYTIAPNESNINLINELIAALEFEQYNKIIRTKKGNISIAKQNWRPPCWDMIEGKRSYEFTICGIFGFCRILIGNIAADRIDENGQRKLTGRESWKIFEEVRKKTNCPSLDRVRQSVAEGHKAKARFEHPIIEIGQNVEIGINHTYHNVNHIDLHSAHCAGMAAAHPEYRPAFEYLFSQRKTNPEYKHVLTHIWGYAQSKYVGEMWADWSRLALEWTNKRVRDMANRLTNSGRRVLLFNTDGIWYQGDPIEDEGSGLGQWANDHIGCRLRIKSRGAYEYEEPDGSYHAVIRGVTKMDKIIERDKWEWGDLFDPDRSEVLMTKWDDKTQRLVGYWTELDEEPINMDDLVAALFDYEADGGQDL